MRIVTERAAAPSWSSISTEFLRAELARRDEAPVQPVCGSAKRGSYDTAIHVFALFLILALSTIACGIPLVSRRSSKGNTGPNRFVFISQHFGTGVLIATAFVHLLPTAFSSLTDPCLPFFFSRGYRPLAGLVAMFSALVVAGLEMFLTTRGAGHSHSHGGSWDAVPDREGRHNHTNGSAKPSKKPLGRLGKLGLNRRPRDLALEDMGASEGLVEGASPLPVSTPTPTSQPQNRDDNQIDDDDDSDLDLNELDPTAPPFTHSHTDVEIAPQRTESGPSRAEQQKRQMLQCILLEAGILFHSVFIGMAVSVATGTPFVVFLVAISFHQSFEGLALGSRIAAIDFPKHSPKPWLMVLAYGATTPIGQAIGLFLHKLYDPQSAAGLLMVGFMNAISSGLLLFSGLVQLLAEDFLSEKSYGILRGRRRVQAFSAVLAGASLMAFVGVWA
ncbi:zip family zinc transporter [Diplocarpon rosae]|nr:zip family zinc transporter [Diplocarpon rosae]